MTLIALVYYVYYIHCIIIISELRWNCETQCQIWGPKRAKNKNELLWILSEFSSGMCCHSSFSIYILCRLKAYNFQVRLSEVETKILTMAMAQENIVTSHQSNNSIIISNSNVKMFDHIIPFFRHLESGLRAHVKCLYSNDGIKWEKFYLFFLFFFGQRL